MIQPPAWPHLPSPRQYGALFSVWVRTRLIGRIIDFKMTCLNLTGIGCAGSSGIVDDGADGERAGDRLRHVRFDDGTIEALYIELALFSSHQIVNVN